VKVEPMPNPGFWSFVAHLMVVAVLGVLVLAVWPLRAGAALLAEILIRASDTLADALADRLSK
jgi:hypothetical protein